MATVPKTPVVPATSEIEARVSEGASFDGHWKGDNIVVLGRLEGELTLSGRLRVGRSGSVLGRVKADSVELGGEFTGEIQARLILITESARARGTFVSERLLVQEGASVDGAFDQPKAPGPPAAAKPPAQATQPGLQRTPSETPPAGAAATPAPGEAKPPATPDDTVPPKP